MALIICPNCGKRVSSTTESCVHCGCVLKKCVEVRKYKSLDSSETEALQKEFSTLNPEFAEYEKEVDKNATCFNRYLRVLKIISIVGFFAIGLSLWAMLAVDSSGILFKRFTENPITYLPLFAFGFGVVCYFGVLVLLITGIFLVRQFNKHLAINYLIITTKYKAWLKETKNIDYEITGIKDKYMDYVQDFEYDGIDKIEIKRG